MILSRATDPAIFRLKVVINNDTSSAAPLVHNEARGTSAADRLSTLSLAFFYYIEE